MIGRVYLIELTEHKWKGSLKYYPFIIWSCFAGTLDSYISHIKRCYGKIKVVWECDSIEDAENWREEILRMRSKENLI